MHLVSPSPSFTDILGYLDASHERLASVTDHCSNEIPDRIKRVGSPKALRINEIDNLAPDYILALEGENRPEEIRELQKKFRVLHFQVRSIPAVIDTIHAVAGIIRNHPGISSWDFVVISPCLRYSMPLMTTAYLVIAHGSREKEANTAFFDFLAQLQRAFPDRVVQGAFLELVSPSIPEAIELCTAKGAQQIIIMPLMFFPGRHVKTDIPAFIQQAKEKRPEIDFHYTGPLCESPLMLKVLEEKAKALTHA